ncbi:hypothetical protein [Confluentibacter sediminis]|uniref:hypothetical protein n=1 Tax=Confluentibacter sediminis TaxID=2219045 RepID=UPI0013A6AC07|nr:hypothetical protein [Confluentibacter sediminis]
MKVFSSILLFILCFVASTQLIAKYWSPYLYFDDILFLIITGISVLDIIITNKYSRTYSYLVIAFIIFIFISFLFNFYSLNAFLSKSFFYAKPLLTFVFVSYLSNKYMLFEHKKKLYTLFILICLFSLLEFYIIQYVDRGYIHYFSYSQRYGYYRASSVTYHPISLGLLAFFGIVIGREVIEDKRKWPYLVFVVSLILTGTRFVMLLMAVYFIYRFIITKKIVLGHYKFPLKHIYTCLYPFIFFTLFGISTYVNIKDYHSIRSLSLRSGVELLLEPKTVVLGTGLGSFGTSESVLYESEVYDKIYFPEHYKTLLVSGNNSKAGTENFFFMALVEFGIFGLLLYYFIILRIPNKRYLSYFFTFYVLLVVSITFVYPLNTLPFMYLINIFFPFGRKNNKSISS